MSNDRYNDNPTERNDGPTGQAPGANNTPSGNTENENHKADGYTFGSGHTENTYGGSGYGFGTYQAPPQSPYQAPREDGEGSGAQVLGIISLVLSFICCQLAGIICGIIAMNKSKASRLCLGYESPEARVGRICGLIAIIAGCLMILANIALSALIGLLTALGQSAMLLPPLFW